MNELYVVKHPKSSATEGFRTIRTNLKFSSAAGKIKTILITSSEEGEGKSFVSSNLAATYAMSGDKVLLIDCDLRRGTQQRIFGLKNKTKLGMSNLLIDSEWKKSLHDYINATDVKNLSLLLSGTIPPNPTVLLESDKFGKIVEELEKEYDIIIFDTPPVNGLNDTQVISRVADASLIVVSNKKTNNDMLEKAKKTLENVGAGIAGVILNRSLVSDSKYYKSYYYDE